MTTGATNALDHPLAPGPEHFLSGQNDLVVALPHLTIVRAALSRSGIPIASVTASAPLGLALVKIPDFYQLSPQVQEQLREIGRRTGHPRDYIGQVLEAVKQTFGSSPHRWEPTIGRNRLVGSVAATDGRVIVAYGEPQLITVPAQRLAPRGTNHRNDPRSDQDSVVPIRRTRIGIADTPLRQHAWLGGSWLAPYPEPLPGGKSWAPNYRAGHATAVAGLVLDAAPEADVQVRAILDDEGVATSWDVGTGLIEFAGSGIDILNLSFACYTLDGQPPLCLSAAIERLQPETLVVAAAGNYGSVGVTTTEAGDIDLSTAPAWPAALPNVVAVGSCNKAGERSAFSPDAPWVSVLSIGEGVASLLVRDLLPGATTDDEFAHWTGTSFSAARVTGAIAAKVRPGSASAAHIWNSMMTDGVMIVD